MEEYETIKLAPEAAEKLRRPIEGQGGWQSLLRRFQSRLNENNETLIYENEIEMLRRYVEDYGSGGWEGRLEGILDELRSKGYSI